MSGFSTVWLVARRDLIERGKSKSYMWSTGFTIVLLLGVILVPALLSSDEPTVYQVGIVGENNTVVIDTAAALFDQYYDEDPPQITATSFSSREEAVIAVREGRADAALIGGSTILIDDEDTEIERVLQDAGRAVALSGLLAEGQAEVVQRLTGQPLTVDNLSQPRTDDTEDNDDNALVAYGATLLLYMAILTYGTWLLTGVTEEKTTRVVEVLLSVVKPYQLLAGKVIGIGILGLSQLLLTVLLAIAAITLTGVIDLPKVPFSLYPSLLLWFILGYALYSVGFATAGALVSRTEDAQNASFPLTIVAVISLIGSLVALGDPDSPVATVATFLPPSAPFVVPIRLATEAISWWELSLSVLISVLFTVGLIRVAGRVYAGGLLRFGGRVKIREALSSSE